MAGCRNIYMKPKDIVQQKLVTLGLTPQQANIYLLVLKNPKIQVKEISNQLNILVASVHRSLFSLREKGLILSFGKRPIKLTAVAPSVGLIRIINQDYQQRILLQKQIEDEMNKKMSGRQELDVKFLESKQETFDCTLPIIKRLKKELYILSIGEPIPEKIFLSIVEAIRRGVEVKILAEKYDESNKELLENWQKNGFQIRYLTKPLLDFSLTIHDGESCIVQIRREKEKEQRVGIAIANLGYARAQRQYFLSLWSAAKPI